MACTEAYIVYVCEQINGVGAVRYKKMFGEYMIYANDKPIFLVCDNTVYVKNIEDIRDIMIANHANLGMPYPGAKEHFILDVENVELSKEIASMLEKVIPVPKPRNKKKK
ncbi:MAG: TfoX/Sxy family protein [Anaerotignum sp.]